MAGKNGNKKFGRTKKKPCQQRYTSEKRWEKNKRKKIEKHLKDHPEDKQSEKALKSL